MNFPIFPPQGSVFAHQVDHLYFALIAFSAAMILLVVLPIIYFLFKYRRGKKANRRESRLPETMIEITWITIPLILMVGLYAWGADLYFHEQRPPVNALEINVIGKQWMWKTQHPEGNREINELHVPLGRTIRLNLASQDVIHSFFLPAFRIKKRRNSGLLHHRMVPGDQTRHFPHILRRILRNAPFGHDWERHRP
jgi:cytochrome c oxidase subunit 2